jgi:hypothetical protein
MRSIVANLTPASGCQDHTALPYASRLRQRLRRGLRQSAEALAKAEAARTSLAPPASTASRLNVRDDRDTPLFRGGTARVVDLICPTGKAKYFFVRGWTGNTINVDCRQLICPPGKVNVAFVIPRQLLALSSPGIAARRTASLPLAYDPVIHLLRKILMKRWMPGSRLRQPPSSEGGLRRSGGFAGLSVPGRRSLIA